MPDKENYGTFYFTGIWDVQPPTTLGGYWHDILPAGIGTLFDWRLYDFC